MKFKLYGMVDHIGSLQGGHYTATILSNEDTTWYNFNDEHVNKVSRILLNVSCAGGAWRSLAGLHEALLLIAS